jgi:DNA-binding transcriptional LysR family regulator
LVASPAYLTEHGTPDTPQSLLEHRLLAFSFWRPDYHWDFHRADRTEQLPLPFHPVTAINDYAGLYAMLVEGAGIGELPPIMRPNGIETGRLVEVLPEWHLPVFNLYIAYPSTRQIPRQVRAFRELSMSLVPSLFPGLPQ